MMLARDRDETILNISICLLYIPAIFKYGYRVIFSLLILLVTSIVLEKIVQLILKNKTKYFNVYTILLIPLILPSTLPFYMLISSTIFGVVIAYVFFGGVGKEVISPLPLSWGFAVLSFPDTLSSSWIYPFPGFGQGFLNYSPTRPLFRHPITFIQEVNIQIGNVMFGDTPGTPGSAFPLMLIVIGVILIILKVIDSRTSLIFLLTFTLLSLLKVENSVEDIFKLILSGNFLISAFFILPYFRLSSRTTGGAIISSIIAGVTLFLIRFYSSHPDGVLFAVLVYRIFSPLIDDSVLSFKARKRSRYA